MLKTFIGTYIPDFNSIPSAVLEKKFLENAESGVKTQKIKINQP
jgi:hypothetical protein